MTPSARERAEDRRHAAIQRGRGIHYKLGRILDMYEDAFSDAEIAEALGWSKRTVIRYRQVLQLALGRDCGGRWRDAS
jgi:hypothetical protein